MQLVLHKQQPFGKRGSCCVLISAVAGIGCGLKRRTFWDFVDYQPRAVFPDLFEKGMKKGGIWRHPGAVGGCSTLLAGPIV
jgi:hypothetical protein